ncbi:MAG: hypothetical protein MZV63_17810 [Marinilabiliales bacterium]|nr:hypothetical protein [Marinilabiliales bacterium]
MPNGSDTEGMTYTSLIRSIVNTSLPLQEPRKMEPVGDLQAGCADASSVPSCLLSLPSRT